MSVILDHIRNTFSGYSGGGVDIKADGATQVTLTNVGRVGIGISVPATELDVLGQIKASNGFIGQLVDAISTAFPFTSTVVTGTAPFIVASTTKVNNLSVDNSAKLNGKTWASPDPIGTTTKSTGDFTSLSATSFSLVGDTVQISEGGTGASTASQALDNLLPTGEAAGLVLTATAPGSYYWGAGGGGTAAEIAFTPVGALASINVQAALAEVDSEKQPVHANLTTLANTGNVPTATTATNAPNYLPLSGGTITGSIIRTGGGTIVQGFDTSLIRGSVYSDAVGFGILNNTGGWAARVNYGTSDWYVTGNVTAYSDERVKTNWRDMPSDFIEKLSVVKHGIYDRTDQELTQVGVSAQSLQSVLPDAVIHSADDSLSVAYGNAALVAAIQLAKEVVVLRAEIQSLKQKSMVY